MNKHTNFYKKPQTGKDYVQTSLDKIMPILIERIIETNDGKFVFTHEQFPDLRVEGVTLGFVIEHLERVIRKLLKGQSDKHIDYLCVLLVK